MLPDSITLSDGAVNVVYASKTQVGPNAVRYFAPSPNSDLSGRPTLDVVYDITKAGIARSVVTLTEPIQDSAGKYVRFSKVTITGTISGNDPIAIREKQLIQGKNFLTSYADEMAAQVL